MPCFLLNSVPLRVRPFPQQSVSVNTSLGFPLPAKANTVNSRKGKSPWLEFENLSFGWRIKSPSLGQTLFEFCRTNTGV